MHHFVSNCEQFYGSNFLVCNIRSLLHLGDDTKFFKASLDDVSSFPFENVFDNTEVLCSRAVTVLKPKPKTAVLRRNRTATEPWFSGGYVTVFLQFQKWPSPAINVPKQQPNYRLVRTPVSIVWSDRLTARSGVARQPNYPPWQVNLCAAVGAVRTDAYIQVDSQPCTPNMWMSIRSSQPETLVCTSTVLWRWGHTSTTCCHRVIVHWDSSDRLSGLCHHMHWTLSLPTQPVGLLQRCFCWSTSLRRSTSAVHS